MAMKYKMYVFLIFAYAALGFDKYALSSGDTFFRNKDKDRFWMFDEFWESSFDIPWTPRQDPNKGEAIIERNHFSMWTDDYKDWSEWSGCDPVKCIVTRYKECKDNSWKKSMRYVNSERRCTIQYVYEVRECKENEKCRLDSSKNFAIDKLPETCGHGPKLLQGSQVVEGNSGDGEWPWNAGLYIKGKYEALVYTCGATLINHGWAITASECLRSIEKINDLSSEYKIDTREFGIYNDVELVVGDNDRVVIEGTERKQKISHIVFHPDRRIDVALLKIDDAINSDQNVYFPCLSMTAVDSSATCFVVGWNKNKFQIPYYFWGLEFSWESDQFKPSTRKYKQKNSSLLQQVKVSLTDFEKCQKVYPFYNLNARSHMCASTRSKKFCRGDSGGGLVCYDANSKRWNFQGITNFVEYQGCQHTHEFYVTTSSILDWIKSTIKTPFPIIL